jgi:preprotein translocase subunit SecG
MGLFIFLVILFTIVSTIMVLIILVQRPQGGGLAGAFGGAGGGGTDTVFGGRVGDALTLMTVIAFAVYMLLAIGLNIVDNRTLGPAAATAVSETTVDAPQAQPGAVPPAGTDFGAGGGPSAEIQTIPPIEIAPSDVEVDSNADAAPPAGDPPAADETPQTTPPPAEGGSAPNGSESR